MNKLERLKKVAYQFNDNNPTGFNGSLKEVKRIIKEEKSPLLNHLLIESMNWDYYDTIILYISKQEYTDISTLVHIYWLCEPEFHIENIIKNLEPFESEIYDSVSKRLFEIEESEGLFWVSPNGITIAEDSEFIKYVPPLALKSYEGKEWDSDLEEFV